ncbi:hypothetical protein [Rhodoferax sp.]|uniref:hypothetical protein n=1 Tax=Rhodoferax sp. TaxID=50421 RepID=UPI0026233656|nr:hypothetical protein [Rhodoferax sp.]MDD3937585.1 hypothetical protein [Rhodoferax sp.]
MRTQIFWLVCPHFHSKYSADFNGARSYSWIKTVLQGAGAARTSKRRGKHHIKRKLRSLAGRIIHQDASTPPMGA